MTVYYNYDPLIPRVGLNSTLSGEMFRTGELHMVTNEILWTSDTKKMFVEQNNVPTPVCKGQHNTAPYVIGWPSAIYQDAAPSDTDIYLPRMNSDFQNLVVSGLNITLPNMRFVFPNTYYDVAKTTISIPYQGGKYNSAGVGVFRLWVKEEDGSYFLDEVKNAWNQFDWYDGDMYLCEIGTWPQGNPNTGIWWCYRKADMREVIERPIKTQLAPDRLINDYLIKPKDYTWSGELTLKYQEVVETSGELLYLCTSPGTISAVEPTKPSMADVDTEVYSYGGFGDQVNGSARIRYIGREKYAGYWRQGQFGGISIFSSDCTNWLLRCPRELWEPVKDYIWMGLKAVIKNAVTERLNSHTYEKYMKVTGTYRWDGWVWEALNDGTTQASTFDFLAYECEIGTTASVAFTIGSSPSQWTADAGWTTDGSTLTHTGAGSYIEFNNAMDPGEDYCMSVWAENIGDDSYAKLYLGASEGLIYDYGWSGYLIDREGQYHTRQVTSPSGTPKFRIYAVGDVEIDDARVYKTPVLYSTTKTGDGTIDWICIGRSVCQKSPTVTWLFMDMDSTMEKTTYTDAQDALPFCLTLTANIMRELGILPDEFYYGNSPHRDYWNNPRSWFECVGDCIYACLIMNFHAPSGTLNWGSFGNLSSNGQQIFYPFNLFEDSCGTWVSLDAMAKLSTDPRAGVINATEEYYRSWANTALAGLYKYWNSTELCFDYYMYGETEASAGIDYSAIPEHTWYAYGQCQYTPIGYSIPLGWYYIKAAIDWAESFWPEWYRKYEQVSPYATGFDHIAACVMDRTEQRRKDILDLIETEGFNQPLTGLDSPMFINFVQWLYLKSVNTVQAFNSPMLSLNECVDVSLQVIAGGTDCTTGDGKYYYLVPGEMKGKKLSSVVQSVVTPGVTGTMDVQVNKRCPLWELGGYWSAWGTYTITNPSGTTFRYTYTGTAGDITNPHILDDDTSLRANDIVEITSTSFNAANTGTFTITAVGTDWFEVTNASGVAEGPMTFNGSYICTRFRDMLSTKSTLDSGDYDSRLATTREVVNSDVAEVFGYDLLRIDVDAIHSGTAAKGLIVGLRFQ